MASLFDTLTRWSSLSLRLDDDLYDRLSHRYTVAILIAATVVVSGRQFVAEKIRCQCPHEWNIHTCNYVQDYCYINAVYRIPYDAVHRFSRKSQNMVNYYMWVSLFLLIQAIMFILPAIIWRHYNDSIGFQISAIVTAYREKDIIADPEKREHLTKRLVLHTVRYFEHIQRTQHETRMYAGGLISLRMPSSIRGSAIYSFYMLTKLLYLANAIGQLHAIGHFLGDSGYFVWGFKAFNLLLSEGRLLDDNQMFPNATLCDFELPDFTGFNWNRFTVMCVLPSNAFNHVIFLCLWFWFLWLSLATTYGSCTWLLLLVVRSRTGLCMNYLERALGYHGRVIAHKATSDADSEHPMDITTMDRLIRKFSHFYIRAEEMFVLQMLQRNLPDLFFSEFILVLWNNFVQRQLVRRGGTAADQRGASAKPESYAGNRSQQSAAVGEKRDCHPSSPPLLPCSPELSEVLL